MQPTPDLHQYHVLLSAHDTQRAYRGGGPEELRCLQKLDIQVPRRLPGAAWRSVQEVQQSKEDLILGRQD